MKKIPPIVSDYVKLAEKARNPKFSVETRIKAKRKALMAFSVMTVGAQNMALRLGGSVVAIFEGEL